MQKKENGAAIEQSEKTRIVFFDQLCIISAGEIKEKGQRVKKIERKNRWWEDESKGRKPEDIGTAKEKLSERVGEIVKTV